MSYDLRYLNFRYFQPWEEKAVEDRKRYDAEMEKWKAEGGLEALKAAKKAAKAEKRRAKAGQNPTAKAPKEKKR